MEAVVPKAGGGEPVDVGCADVTAKATELRETEVARTMTTTFGEPERRAAIGASADESSSLSRTREVTTR